MRFLPWYAHFPVKRAVVTEMARRHLDLALVKSPETLLMKSMALGPNRPVVSTTKGITSLGDSSGATCL